MSLKKKQKINYSESEEEGEELHLDENDKFNYVMKASGKDRIPLPEYIDLDDPFPGEPPFMKKRSFPAVLRFHQAKYRS